VQLPVQRSGSRWKYAVWLSSGTGTHARTLPTASVTASRVVTSKVRHGASVATAVKIGEWSKIVI